MKRNILLDGDTVPVQLVRRGDLGTLTIAQRQYHCALQNVGAGEYRLTLDGVSHRLWIVQDKDISYVHGFGRSWELEVTNPAERRADEAEGGAAAAIAPMPGIVVSVMVQAGDVVEKGQTLMIIESMKMQSDIAARNAGRVEAVMVSVGDTFERGARLVALAPQE